METQTKTVPIEKHVYEQLERKAKLEGITTDEYAEKLCLRAMIATLEPDLCRNCKSAAKIKVMVPECFPLSSCELCEILQHFVEAFSCLKENSVEVPIDANLLAEAKKWNINIEEATREHFEKVKDDLLLDMICGSSEVRIEGELLKDFEAIKKHFGIKEDINVIRKLIDVAYEKHVQEKEKVKDAKEPEPIEYMQVTLKIPKACLMYLNEYVRTEAWLEDRLVEAVRAEYADRSFGTWKADEIGLSPVFWQLLKDKRYHPDSDIREAAIEEPTA